MRCLIFCVKCRWNAYKKWHECTMTMYWQSFSKEVGQVVSSLTPEDSELFLPYPISNPVELHVDGFCLFQSDSVGGEANYAHVVTENVGCRLRVSETVENCTERGPILGVHKYSCVFRFSNGGHNNRNDGAWS